VFSLSPPHQGRVGKSWCYLSAIGIHIDIGFSAVFVRSVTQFQAFVVVAVEKRISEKNEKRSMLSNPLLNEEIWSYREGCTDISSWTNQNNHSE